VSSSRWTHLPPFKIPCKLNLQTDSSWAYSVELQKWLWQTQDSIDHFLSLPWHSWDKSCASSEGDPPRWRWASSWEWPKEIQIWRTSVFKFTVKHTALIGNYRHYVAPKTSANNRLRPRDILLMHNCAEKMWMLKAKERENPRIWEFALSSPDTRCKFIYSLKKTLKTDTRNCSLSCLTILHPGRLNFWCVIKDTTKKTQLSKEDNLKGSHLEPEWY
jgi:hypothetical protein